MLFLVILSLVFLFMNYCFNNYISVKLKKNSFESGFNSIGKTVVSYSLSFFFLVLIFVFFEIEFFLIFFLVFFSLSNFYLFVLVIFLVTLGLFVEWSNLKLVFMFS